MRLCALGKRVPEMMSACMTIHKPIPEGMVFQTARCPLSKETRILFFDEVSMIGRQFMGRIDSRLHQGRAGLNPNLYSLGGVSGVCSGDPAQCDAISDQQMYDTSAHRDTVSASDAQRVQLSNAGMSVYDGFNQVVVLSKIHRLTRLSEATTKEQRMYNQRCVRFAEIPPRMRDMTLTSDDLF